MCVFVFIHVQGQVMAYTHIQYTHTHVHRYAPRDSKIAYGRGFFEVSLKVTGAQGG